jgi:hypothetical protein
MNTTASGSDGDDPMREPRAYNTSIYIMVSMPYLLLGTFGFLVFWKSRTAVTGLEENGPSAGETPSPDV